MQMEIIFLKSVKCCVCKWYTQNRTITFTFWLRLRWNMHKSKNAFPFSRQNISTKLVHSISYSVFMWSIHLYFRHHFSNAKQFAYRCIKFINWHKILIKCMQKKWNELIKFITIKRTYLCSVFLFATSL